MKYIHSLKLFFQYGLWEKKLSSLPPFKAWLYRQLRIFIIAFKEYQFDKCQEKASSLTFFTLLSTVPIIAMAFGIATAFGLEDYMHDELERYFSGQQEVLDYTIKFADSMLNNASGGIISGISLLFLIYAVVRLFNNIEVAFNDVWDTTKSRSIQRKLSDYMSIIFLAPILLIISSTATVFITTQVEILITELGLIGSVSRLIMFFINLIPYSLVWLLLFLIYLIFPNTKVNIKAALTAGILAGTIYQITQWAYINFQVGVSNYSAIYGSFAALPLFLIWVNISWLIVLFGAEFSYAVQNVNKWKHSEESFRVNFKLKKRLYLLILKFVVENFKLGKKTGYTEISDKINLPGHFLLKCLDDLQIAELINKIEAEDEELYQPSEDIHKMTMAYLIDKIEAEGIVAVDLGNTEHEYLSSINKVLDEMTLANDDGTGKKLLMDI